MAGETVKVVFPAGERDVKIVGWNRAPIGRDASGAPPLPTPILEDVPGWGIVQSVDGRFYAYTTKG